MIRTTKRTILFSLGFSILFFGLCFGLSEICVRKWKGAQPWMTPEQARILENSITVEPGGKLNKAHPTLGFTHWPGKYTVTIGPPYYFHFHMTHLEDEYAKRITHPLETYPPDPGKPEVWVFGCSMTHGWSLSDDETYPWRLQAKLPGYEVLNFGTGGYGNVQSLVQLREMLQKGRKPEVAILGYMYGHQVRNVFSRAWQKMIAPFNRLGPVRAPYARIGRDGKLQHLMADLVYSDLPLQRYSAFVNYLDDVYSEQQFIHLRSHEVAKGIIKEFSDLCQRHNIKFLVAFLWLSIIDQEQELPFCQKEGIATVEMPVDLSLPEYNNNPYDGHPSALANQVFADKIEEFLVTNHWVKRATTGP